jgi:hypothetical protein
MFCEQEAPYSRDEYEGEIPCDMMREMEAQKSPIFALPFHLIMSQGISPSL